MRTLTVCAILALSLPAVTLAQEDAGLVTADAGVVDAGTIALTDGGVVAVNPEALDDLMPIVLVTKTHIQNGDWLSAVASILVILIGLFRMFAKKIHELIPDENPIDKIFWFMLETNVGGWITNFLTTTAFGIASVLLVGEPITWALLKPILALSLSAAGIVKLVKDIWAWIQGKIDAKKAATPTEPPTTPGA